MSVLWIASWLASTSPHLHGPSNQALIRARLRAHNISGAVFKKSVASGQSTPSHFNCLPAKTVVIMYVLAYGCFFGWLNSRMARLS